jgi:hypothetical protein
MAPWTMPSVTFAKRDNSPAMPIRQFLNGERFDPETTRIMGVAFEAARIALRLADRGDAFAPIVAKRIIELAKTGERNPNVLCEAALEACAPASPPPSPPPLDAETVVLDLMQP